MTRKIQHFLILATCTFLLNKKHTILSNTVDLLDKIKYSCSLVHLKIAVMKVPYDNSRRDD